MATPKLNIQPGVAYPVVIGETFGTESSASFHALHFKFIPQSVDLKQPGFYGKQGNQVTLQFQQSNNDNVSTFKGEGTASKTREAVFFFDGQSCQIEMIESAMFNIKKTEGNTANPEMAKIIEASKKRKREEGDAGPASKAARKTSLSKQFGQFETKGKSVGRFLTTGHEAETVSLSPLKRSSRGRPSYNDDLYDESDGGDNIDALFGESPGVDRLGDSDGKGDSPEPPVTPTGEKGEASQPRFEDGAAHAEQPMSSSSSSDDDDF